MLEARNVSMRCVLELPGRASALSGGAERIRAAISSTPAEPSGLERPFRALQRRRAGSKSQTSASAVFSKPGRAELSRLERPCRTPQQSRGGSSGHFERPGGAERALAAISSAPAEPSRLERPFRVPQRSRGGSKSQTSAGAVFASQANAAKAQVASENPRPEGNFNDTSVYPCIPCTRMFVLMLSEAGIRGLAQ